jgi:hypothetical protein
VAKIDVNEIQGLMRVGRSVDSKGNEVYVLEFLGVPVLYADAHEFEAGRMDGEDWEDCFKLRLARLMGKALTEQFDNTHVKWHLESPTGREVLRLGPFGDEL